MSFAYGQRHEVELAKAKKYAPRVGAEEHLVVDFDLRRIGGSALTSDQAVPKSGVEEGVIPVTYVPARNTIFLSFALGWAEVLGAFDIFIGVNALDYSGYPDCRPEFVEAFERLANLATKAGAEGRRRFTVHTPLIRMSKKEIIRTGLDLGVDFGLTVSCYDPDVDGAACGACDACRLRLKGFAELGTRDPARYRSGALP
jgi:7-cyano-7-deazaguanine synthase